MSPLIEPLESRSLFAAIGGVGTLDTTLNGTGRTTVSFGQRSLAVLYNTLVQPDGKILLIGSTRSIDPDHPGTDIAVARLNPDSTLDMSFGFNAETNESGGGLAALPLNGDADAAYGAALQPDGRILVVGSIANTGAIDPSENYTRAVLLRLTPSGRPDPTIKDDNVGDGGIVFPILSSDPANDSSEGRAVAVQADGKIIVAGGGDIVINGDSSSFSVARFNADGSVDSSFGPSGTGVYIDSSPGYFEKAFQIALNPDQSILVTGTIFTTDAAADFLGAFLVEKLDTTGNLDTTFGRGGAAVVLFPKLFPDDPNEGVRPISTTLALQPDGKIVLGGTVFHLDISPDANGLGTAAFGVARLNPDGSNDLTFGQRTGLVETYFGTDVLNPVAVPIANQVTVLPNKTILLVGRANLTSGPQGDYSTIAVARFTANGTLDKAFNKTGQLLITPNGTDPLDDPLPDDSVAGQLSQSAATAAVVPGGGILLLASTGQSTVNVTRLIADGPDLVTRILAAPQGMSTGSTQSLRLTVTNQGSLPLKAKLPLTLRLSTDPTYDSTDTLLSNIILPVSLSAGVQKSMTVNFTVPATLDLDDDYYLVAATNESQSLVESNFLNNAATAPTLTAVAPAFLDLTGMLALSSFTLKPKGKSTFLLTLSNSGNVTASGSILLQLFSSADAAESADDLPLLSPRPTRITVKPFSSITLKLPGQLPATATPGTYTLLLKLSSSQLPLSRTPIKLTPAGTLTVT